MLCEVRFVTRGVKYDRTVAKKQRECRTLSEALRWAAAVLAMSQPDEIAAVSAIRVRIVKTDQQAQPLPPMPPGVPELVKEEHEPRRRARSSTR